MSSPIPAINEQLLIPSYLKFSLAFGTARSVFSLAGWTPHWNPLRLPQGGWNERLTPQSTCQYHYFEEDD